VTLYHADARDILPYLSGVTAVVTDPPYGLEFMGKEWDKLEPARARQRWDGKDRKLIGDGSGKGGDFAARMGEQPNYRPKRNPKCKTCGHYKFSGKPCVCERPDWDHRRQEHSNAIQAWHQQWAEPLLAACLPGAPLLAFGGTRTYHRLVCAIEDAGWEIRDCLAWIYGQGFPKSKDISKAIDDAAGAEREVVGVNANARPNSDGRGEGVYGGGKGSDHTPHVTAPATPLAQLWNGWGTSLKPAHEPICLAMKPLDGTFAANAEKYGVAGLAIDRCRIETNEERPLLEHTNRDGNIYGAGLEGSRAIGTTREGRWPANLIHDGSDEVLEVFPETGEGAYPASRGRDKERNAYGSYAGQNGLISSATDSGSAARFFKQCSPDNNCRLCSCVIAPRHGIMNPTPTQGDVPCNKPHAPPAKRSLKTIRATIASIALSSAGQPVAESLALRVPFAESLCDSCATRIALGLVAIKTSGSSSEALLPILDSIGSSNVSILTQNLVPFAELWANIDTIPTTESLSILCGSVLHATEDCIRLESKAAEAPRYEPSRFVYVPKADKAERGPGNAHPTVKPLALMSYLCKLVSMPGYTGTLLDPFAGSGSTLLVATRWFERVIGIEREEKYCETIVRRLESQGVLPFGADE
jgi:site-specific DNA-methyltransferase (adenine-specific)